MSDFATNTKKPWSREEDALLAKLVASHGTNNWTGLAELLSQQTQSLIRGNGGGMMGTTRRGIMVPLELQRSGKQCRERWHNHVNPTVRKGEWTSDEDALIVALQKQLGNQWAKIAKHLNGRSDNAVKNRFHAIIRARTSQHPVSTTAYSSSSPACGAPSVTTTPGSKLGTPGTVSSTATTVSNSHYHHHLLHQQQPNKSRRIDTFSPLAAHASHASHSYHSQQQQQHLPPTPSHINMNVNMNVYINSQRNKSQDSSATPHAGHATYVKPEVVTAIPILDDAYIKPEKRKMPSTSSSLTIEAPTHTYQQQQQQQQAYHTRSQAKTPTSSQHQQQQHLSSQSFGAFMCATPTHAHGNPFMMFSHQHQGHHHECFDMYCARTQTQSTSPVPALTSLLTLSPVTVDEDFLQYWCVDDEDDDDDVDEDVDVDGVDEEKQQDMQDIKQEPILFQQQQQQQLLNKVHSSHSMDVDVCMVDVMCVDLDMLVDHAQSHAHAHVSELMF